MSQIGPKYVSWNLLNNGSLLSKAMQTLLWKETKFHNRIDTSAWRQPIDSVTIPIQHFSHQLKKKIALLELEMCYLQVRSCLSQVRIIRISQQTSSWANPTFKVPFRFLVVCWDSFFSMIVVETLMTVSVFVLVAA